MRTFLIDLGTWVLPEPLGQIPHEVKIITNRLLRSEGIMVNAKGHTIRNRSVGSTVEHPHGLPIRNGAHAPQANQETHRDTHAPRARVLHDKCVCAQANQETHRDIGAAHL